jgi:hypothetical protein
MAPLRHIAWIGRGMNPAASGSDQKPMSGLKNALGCLIGPLVFLGVVGAILGTLWVLLLLAWMDVDFESGGVRAWWYVSGSLNERLGLVEPIGKVQYRYTPPDGPGLASISAIYRSPRSPAEIIAHYERACEAEKHPIISRESLVPPAHADERFVKCDGKAGEVSVTATPSAPGTEVTILVFYYPS